jgi:hypothetical protein
MPCVRYFHALVAICVALQLSCNIFAPSEGKRIEAAQNAGADAVILEGKLRMQKADWQGALNLFNYVLDTLKDSSKSEAFFYKGKCILRLADVNLSEVWNEVNPPAGFTNNVPFLFHDGSLLYAGSCTNTCDACSGDSCFVSKHLADTLAKVFRLSPDSPDSAITVADSVFLQRKRVYDATCAAISTLEYINYHQTQLDGAIVRAQYESDYLVEISIRTALGFIDINNNGHLDYGSPGNPTNEQEAFRVLCLDVPSLDSMSLDSIKQISKDPKQINDKINELLVTIGRADTSYGNFRSEIDSAHMDTSMAQSVGDMVSKFKQILPYYYYDDCTDNDSNWYNTDGDTVMDRMIWIDWDDDEMIDVNAPGVLPHVHIGQPAHREAHPELYENVGEQKNYFRYKYKGPHTHEFIFGDWGVDEEIMDGVDNTFDSLIDEDSRVIDDTLDDDGDWDSLRLVTPVKMVWSNSSGFDLGIAFDGSNSKRLAKKGKYSAFSIMLTAAGDSSIKALYSPTIITYTGDPTGNFTAGHYGIDEEWFDGIDNDGDGLIDEDIGIEIPPKDLRQELINKLAANHNQLHAYWWKLQHLEKALRGSK